MGGMVFDPRFVKAHLSTNTTTVIKTGAGVLHSVVINTKGLTANVLTLYDNTAGSGTVIAVIDTTATQGTLFYDVIFNVGLTTVMGVGNAADCTVAYN